MGLTFRNPDPHRQRRHCAVQRLDLGLLVHAEHDRVLRRIQVQPDNVGDFPDQLRIGEEFECLSTPRLYPILTPRISDGAVADLQLVGRQPGTPMSDPELLQWRRQRGGHDLAVVDRAWSARPLLVRQGRRFRTRRSAHTTTSLSDGSDTHQPQNFGVRLAARRQQHDLRPLRQPGTHRRGPRQRRKSRSIAVTQSQRSNSHTELCQTVLSNCFSHAALCTASGTPSEAPPR